MVETELPANEAYPHDGPIEVASLSLDNHWGAYASDRALSKASYPRFHAVLRNLERHLGRIELATVSPDEIGSWREALLGSGISDRSIERVYIPAVRSFFRWAVEAKKVDSNPAARWSRQQDLLDTEQHQR